MTRFKKNSINRIENTRPSTRRSLEPGSETSTAPKLVGARATIRSVDFITFARETRCLSLDIGLLAIAFAPEIEEREIFQRYYKPELK